MRPEMCQISPKARGDVNAPDEVAHAADEEGSLLVRRLARFPFVGVAEWQAIEAWGVDGRQLLLVPRECEIEVWEVDR